MSKALARFIKQYLDQGYDLESIKTHLLNSGYNAKDIDASINQLYSTKHVIHHLSKATIITLVAILIGFSIIIASIAIYLKPSKELLIDVKLEPMQTTVKPGQEIVFIRELTNFGKKVDVTTSYIIISVDTAQTIATYKETSAVETKASRQIRIKIPEDTQLGNAVLNAISSYKDKEAQAALAIKIYQESITATCTDNIKNQDEEKTDCGGICQPCEEQKAECPESCDDNNFCTSDYCNETTNFECKHKQITPCCSNNICEDTESSQKCPKDCIEQQTDIFKGLTLTETLDKIKKIAETDIKSAANYCQIIDIAMYKDSCFRNIAEISKNALFCSNIEEELAKDRCYASIAKLKIDSSACESISKESIRDSCYMNFVLDQRDYSVCDRLINKYLRDSCQTLKQAQTS